MEGLPRQQGRTVIVIYKCSGNKLLIITDINYWDDQAETCNKEKNSQELQKKESITGILIVHHKPLPLKAIELQEQYL